MTMMSRYTWVLHLTCIAICCYFLAQTFSTFIAGMLEGNAAPLVARKVEPAASTREPTAEGGEGKGEDPYRVIADRNIFNSAASAEVAPAPGEQISPEMLGELGPAVKTSLDIKVLGTLVIGDGADRRSSATVSGGTAKGAEVYYVGDEKAFGPSVRLTKVARDRIEFVNGSRLEYAELQDFAAKKSIFSPPEEVHGKGTLDKGSATPAPALKEGGGKIVLEQKEINDALNNLDKLYSEVRLVPNFKDGKTSGFKVLSIKPDSIVAKLQIRRGDVLEKINGEELSVQRGLELFNMLRDQRNFNIDLVRGGQNTTLEYEVH